MELEHDFRLLKNRRIVRCDIEPEKEIDKNTEKEMLKTDYIQMNTEEKKDIKYAIERENNREKEREG